MLWRGYSLNLRFRNTCYIPLQALFQACAISSKKKHTHGNFHTFPRNGIKVKKERFRGAFGARTEGQAPPFRWNVFLTKLMASILPGEVAGDDDMTPIYWTNRLSFVVFSRRILRHPKNFDPLIGWKKPDGL